MARGHDQAAIVVILRMGSISTRQLKQVHTLTHPAKLGPKGAGGTGSKIDCGDLT